MSKFYCGPMKDNESKAVMKLDTDDTEELLKKVLKFAWGPFLTKKGAIDMSHYQMPYLPLFFINCTRPRS